MISTASTHHSNTSNPTPSSEIHAVPSDKGKSDKQPRSKKKGKSKKNKISIPQERSSDQSSRNRKPRYPCIICNEEHFFQDCPHHVEVSKMVKTSHASTVLTNPFPNLDTNLFVTDLASSSQVLMLSITKPSTNVLVSTRNKYYVS